MTSARRAAARGAGAGGGQTARAGRPLAVPLDAIARASRVRAPRTVAVVPAGGLGRRMGAARPKQYLALDGVPLLARTLAVLAGAVDGMVVVVPADHLAATRRLVARHRVPRVLGVVAGGAQRQESVSLGLAAVPETVEWVVVHDAVRPFVTADLVARVLDAAHRHGAATCGVEIRETVKRVRESLVESTVDRAGLWLTQTPQAFRRALLWEAHDKARREGHLGTDDAGLVERLGVPVAMVRGLPANLKITTPDDLAAARRWLMRRRA
jgi:2-C-methyl-D-erythritol 4-phosphate cytidylyltransferase